MNMDEFLLFGPRGDHALHVVVFSLKRKLYTGFHMCGWLIVKQR